MIGAVKWLGRLAEYGYYATLALEAGVPPRLLPTLRSAANLINALSRMDLKSPVRIVDIGAHRGEWAMVCAKLFPKAEILSLEPVPEYFRNARARASRFPRWQVVCAAAGRERGTLPLEVRGQRSSLKRIAGAEFAEWVSGTTPSEGIQSVEVDTLDALLGRQGFSPVDLLKIDAEGYEREILVGASNTLKHTKQILIEVRFYELFEGGPSFWEVHEMLGAQGFALMHLKPCKGQCLWADATYARPGGH